MKTHSARNRCAGITIVELLVGTVVGALVALGVFAFINTGSLLTARNLSVNLTSNSMRGALDRIEHLLQQSNSTPVLMNASGAAVAGNGPAAGVRFDLFQGAPVVIIHLSNGSPLTSLPSATTTFRVRYAQASSRPPAEGDLIIFDTAPSSLRPRIQTVSTPGAPSAGPTAGMREVQVTLTSSLGTAVSATTVLRATIVRDVALCVVAEGGTRQLRYYTDMIATSSMSDATQYKLITEQVATEMVADSTPFSLTSMGARTFVGVNLRVRANTFDRRLLGKQADQFNTFAQVNSFVRPKINP